MNDRAVDLLRSIVIYAQSFDASGGPNAPLMDYAPFADAARFLGGLQVDTRSEDVDGNVIGQRVQ